MLKEAGVANKPVGKWQASAGVLVPGANKKVVLCDVRMTESIKNTLMKIAGDAYAGRNDCKGIYVDGNG